MLANSFGDWVQHLQTNFGIVYFWGHVHMGKNGANTKNTGAGVEIIKYVTSTNIFGNVAQTSRVYEVMIFRNITDQDWSDERLGDTLKYE